MRYARCGAYRSVPIAGEISRGAAQSIAYAKPSRIPWTSIVELAVLPGEGGADLIRPSVPPSLELV